MMDIVILGAILLTFQGLVHCQADDSTCNLEAARPCLQTRQQQYTEYTSRTGGEAPPQTLCLTQVQADKTETCFKQHTQLCSSETAATIRQEWDDLNDNIIGACQKFCPKYTNIAGCKLMINNDGLVDSQFETFCSTFNESLQCANTNLKDCIYGSGLYMDTHPGTITGYWTHICNSGCRNIDVTLAVILECLKPLSNIKNRRDINELCSGHKAFKTCIAESTVVCDEVMTLVLFKHKAYNRLEQLCKPPPTTATTTAATTTTIPTTTTTTTMMETTTTTMKETTTVLETTTPTGDEWNSDALGAALPECLPLEEVRIFTEMTESSQDKLLLLLKIDECLHMVYDSSKLHYFIETLPVTFGQAYHRAKQQSYITAQRLVSRCHADQQACNARLESDPCNSGSTIATFSILSTFLVVLLTGRWLM